MKRAISQLKSFFMTGLYPTQSQFHDWLDSFIHKDDTINISQVSGLAQQLNGKYSAADAANLEQSIASTIESISDLLATKQNSTDVTLDTTAKTVVGAINELFAGKMSNAITLAGLNLSAGISAEELITALSALTIDQVTPSDFVAMSPHWPSGTAGAKMLLVTNNNVTRPAIIQWHYENSSFYAKVFGLVNVGSFVEPSDEFHVLSCYQNTSNPTWTDISPWRTIADKQNSTDYSLSTTNKTVVGAINELALSKASKPTYKTGDVVLQDLSVVPWEEFAQNPNNYSNNSIGLVADPMRKTFVFVSYIDQQYCSAGGGDIRNTTDDGQMNRAFNKFMSDVSSKYQPYNEKFPAESTLAPDEFIPAVREISPYFAALFSDNFEISGTEHTRMQHLWAMKGIPFKNPFYAVTSTFASTDDAENYEHCINIAGNFWYAPSAKWCIKMGFYV